MNVFISWSGIRSKEVGTLLDEWLQCVIQAIKPWMSYKDIDRGSLWFSEISNQLKETTIGIICLTQENKNKPWILFEAGALAKGLSSNRVCTFLIDLSPSDIEDPLAQFNHTSPNKSGMYNLIVTLNGQLGEKCLDPKVLDQVFETYWPQFEEKFNKIILDTQGVASEAPKRDSDDILSEILYMTRRMERRIRDLETPSLPLRDEENERVHRVYRERIVLPEKEIKRLIESGVSEETIIRFMNSSQNIPISTTKRILNRVKDVKELESNDAEE